jgi:hypothetical protein
MARELRSSFFRDITYRRVFTDFSGFGVGPISKVKKSNSKVNIAGKAKT